MNCKGRIMQHLSLGDLFRNKKSIILKCAKIWINGHLEKERLNRMFYCSDVVIWFWSLQFVVFCCEVAVDSVASSMEMFSTTHKVLINVLFAFAFLWFDIRPCKKRKIQTNVCLLLKYIHRCTTANLVYLNNLESLILRMKMSPLDKLVTVCLLTEAENGNDTLGINVQTSDFNTDMPRKIKFFVHPLFSMFLSLC